MKILWDTKVSRIIILVELWVSLNKKYGDKILIEFCAFWLEEFISKLIQQGINSKIMIISVSLNQLHQLLL